MGPGYKLRLDRNRTRAGGTLLALSAALAAVTLLVPVPAACARPLDRAHPAAVSARSPTPAEANALRAAVTHALPTVRVQLSATAVSVDPSGYAVAGLVTAPGAPAANPGSAVLARRHGHWHVLASGSCCLTHVTGVPTAVLRALLKRVTATPAPSHGSAAIAGTWYDTLDDKLEFAATAPGSYRGEFVSGSSEAALCKPLDVEVKHSTGPYEAEGYAYYEGTLAGYLLTVDEATQQPICTAAKRVKATIFINGKLGGILCAGTPETPVICGLNGSEGVISRMVPGT